VQRQYFFVTLLMAGAAAAVGCGDLVRQGNGPVSLVVDTITATAGGGGAANTSFLQSDVVRDTGGDFTDTGSATLRLLHKNPLLTPSSINAVTIQRYTVEYRRTDRPIRETQPGVDVPYPIQGETTLTIASSGIVSFELVRQTQKREAPLAQLRLPNNPVALSVIADVTFFGRDQAGNAVSATGSIGITFSNFGG
jgi:hypothetical protein